VALGEKEKIAKADELPVHNRKGVGNQKEKGMDFYLLPRRFFFSSKQTVSTATYVTEEGGRREEENLGPPNNFKNEK